MHTRSIQPLMVIMRLMRPLNVLIILVSVVLGGLLAGGVTAWTGDDGRRLLLAALSAVCIGAAANSLNDVFDLAIDRLNRPERPLPSGLATPAVARIIWLVGSVLGLVTSLFLSSAHVAMALAAIGLMLVYNAWLKRVPVAGNVVVAVVVGLTLVYGGWAVGTPGPALVGAGFAFLTTLAREVVKDIEDRAGDAASELRTLPLVVGPTAAARCAAVVVLLTLALTPLPFLWLDYGGLYLVCMLLTNALLLWTLALLMDRVPALHASRASRLLKAVMGAGILALAASAAAPPGV